MLDIGQVLKYFNPLQNAWHYVCDNFSMILSFVCYEHFKGEIKTILPKHMIAMRHMSAFTHKFNKSIDTTFRDGVVIGKMVNQV